MQHASIESFMDDPSIADDGPIIAPLLREQIEPMLGGRRDGGVGAPERALMRALLQDAVLCLLGEAAPASERVRLAADAYYWVASRSREWVFSFESVCDELGIDPDYGRRHLMRLAKHRGAADAATGPAVEPQTYEQCALRGVRGLRHSGTRPRKAIHFMSERRRRRQVAEG